MIGSWTAHTKPWDASSNHQTISNKCPPRNGTMFKGHFILQPLIFRGYDWDMLVSGSVILLFFFFPFSAFIFLDVQSAPKRGTWQMFLTWHRLQGIFVGDSMYVFLADPIYSCHVTAQVCWHQSMRYTYKYIYIYFKMIPTPLLACDHGIETYFPFSWEDTQIRCLVYWVILELLEKLGYNSTYQCT